jgi:hypothetical protein
VIAGLLLTVLCQTAPVPAPDAPLMPPQMIDENGVVTKITGVEPLPAGAVCLTHLKAASIRDDLVAKNARITVLEADIGKIDWPLTLGIAGGAAVVVGVIAAAAGFAIGQSSAQAIPPKK